MRTQCLDGLDDGVLVLQEGSDALFYLIYPAFVGIREVADGVDLISIKATGVLWGPVRVHCWQMGS